MTLRKRVYPKGKDHWCWNRNRKKMGAYMLTLEEVIRNNWKPVFKPIDEVDFSYLEQAILSWFKEQLPEEKTTNWTNYDFGYNQAIADILNKLENSK